MVLARSAVMDLGLVARPCLECLESRVPTTENRKNEPSLHRSWPADDGSAEPMRLLTQLCDPFGDRRGAPSVIRVHTAMKHVSAARRTRKRKILSPGFDRHA